MRPHLLLVTLAIVLAPAMPVSAGYSGGCTGFAPFQTTCSGGSHATISPYLELFLSLPHCVVEDVRYCFVGEIVNEADFGSVVYRTTCQVVAVEYEMPVKTCTTEGTFPIGEFVHRCRVTPFTAGTGLPVQGGVGLWGCGFKVRPFF